MRRSKTDSWNRYRGNIYPSSGNIGDDVRGELYIDGVQIRFSLKRQAKPKGYLYRGSVRIISPVDGSILRVPIRGADKMREAKEAIYTNDADIEAVKAYVIERAERLAAKYAEAIRRAGDVHITPATITPRQAYGRYAQRFVAETYKGSKPNEKLNMLKPFYAGLPSEPMGKFSTRAIRDYIRECGFGKARVRYAEAFWQYCLAHQYCTGENPFPAEEKRRKSADVLQSEALRADVLTAREQEELFRLLGENVSALDCGVALMLNGFTTEIICKLTWGQIVFDAERDDFALVGTFLEERAGATHDYTRPCIPQCAELLRKCYSRLRERHSITSLMRARVVGGTQGELSQHAVMQLYRVKGEHLPASTARELLHSTYVRNLVVRCGLDNDPGTLKFLCGYSLYGDTTSSYYTSFTSREAQERLYTILKPLQAERPLSADSEPAASNDDRVHYTITPNTTAQTAGAIVEITLQPGEELEIACSHGVAGAVTAD